MPVCFTFGCMEEPKRSVFGRANCPPPYWVQLGLIPAFDGEQEISECREIKQLIAALGMPHSKIQFYK